MRLILRRFVRHETDQFHKAFESQQEKINEVRPREWRHVKFAGAV